MKKRRQKKARGRIMGGLITVCLHATTANEVVKRFGSWTDERRHMAVSCNSVIPAERVACAVVIHSLPPACHSDAAQ